MAIHRCIACHIEEPGMIAIFQHPRGVDRMWTYVTGIIIESTDELCIPCYDELRVSHRFKVKCISNNIDRLALHQKEPSSDEQQHGPAAAAAAAAVASGDAMPPPPPADPLLSPARFPGRVGDDARPRLSAEKCLQQHPSAEPRELDIIVKSEPESQPQDPQRVIEAVASRREAVEGLLPLETLPVPAPLEAVKMELELSLNDVIENARDVDHDGKENDDTPAAGGENGEQAFNHTEPQAGSGGDWDPSNPSCTKCWRVFQTTEALKQHQQKDHKRGRRDNTIAIKYRRVLTGKKMNPLMCRYCYREFAEQAQKETHEQTHLTDLKPFQCSYADCNRLFTHRSALNRHFYTHVTPKRFKCQLCPKRFHQQSSMVVHERQHRGDRPYICPQCGKGFTHVSNVNRHIRFHNGERPYQCGRCPARFTTSTDLRRHMNSKRCMIGTTTTTTMTTTLGLSSPGAQ